MHVAGTNLCLSAEMQEIQGQIRFLEKFRTPIEELGGDCWKRSKSKAS